MASDTAPAAVPGPNNDPATPHTAPAAGGLTGMLMPVEPARPAAFNLNPTAAVQDTDGHTHSAEGASSAAYSDTGQPENGKNSTGNTSRQERSVVRAWLLAGAKRWEKGADARNKRLDIKKARAQARQVKETVTVNRSEKTGGGATNSLSGGNSGAGKSLSGKGGKQSSGAGQKNTPAKNSSGSSGGSGNSGGSGGGSRTPSGSGTGRGNGGGTSSRTDKTASPKRDMGAKTAKDHGKTPTSGSTSSGKGASGSGTNDGSTSHRKPATDSAKSSGAGGTKPGKDQQHTGPSTLGGKTGAQGPAGKPGKDAPSGKSSNTKPDDATPATKTPNPGAPKNPAPDTAGPNTPQTPPKPGPAAPPGTLGKGLWKSLFTTKPDTRASKGHNNTTGADPQVSDHAKADKGGKAHPARHPRVNTLTSREAGYRDGTRVGKVVAHTQAYRDGYRDGRTDTAQAAARDKRRLDQAHAARKEARTHPEDKPVPQPASSADYQPTTQTAPTGTGQYQPIEVTGTDATHIHLGQGAARPSISRGEVRTLRGFQQRLDTKTDVMTRVAEATRVLEQHAGEQAKQVTQLLEQAQSVKGGDKLVAALTRLQEDAQLQAAKAADIHKRAVWAADLAKALQGNTQTRYGDIYKAVQDAGDVATMSYYQEMSNA